MLRTSFTESLIKNVRRIGYATPIGRALMIAPRIVKAVRISAKPLLYVLPWAFGSREYTTISYDTTSVSRAALCGLVGVVANRDFQSISAFATELESNAELAEHVRLDHSTSDRKWSSDPQIRFGRRMLYYLLIRALKSGFVVEAGVDKGLGAAIICEALHRNEAEGHAGDYLGIENNPLKSSSIYVNFANKRGEIRYGNSSDLIRTISRRIDLFVHETTTDSAHVEAQLEAVRDRMAERGVFASPWALPQFIAYAEKNGKKLLMHQEQAFRHWYPGSRLTVIF